MRNKIKKIAILKYLKIILDTYGNKYGPISRAKLLLNFLADYKKFRTLRRSARSIRFGKIS